MVEKRAQRSTSACMYRECLISIIFGVASSKQRADAGSTRLAFYFHQSLAVFFFINLSITSAFLSQFSAKSSLTIGH